MSFGTGHYKIKAGNRAVVARLTSSGANQWLLRGVVVIPTGEGCADVLIPHTWKISGESIGPDTMFDLVKESE